MSHTDSIRRTDLRVRSRFPHVTTQIYKRSGGGFLIHASRDELSEDEYAEEFDRRVRQATDAVEFINEIPADAVPVEPIADDEIGNDFAGIGFRFEHFKATFMGAFPDWPNLLKLEHKHAPRRIIITFASAWPAATEELASEYLRRLFQLEVVELEVLSPDQHLDAPKPGNNPDSVDLAILSHRQRPNAPEFVKQDEEFWFENIADVFQGRRTPQSFEFAQDAGYACYVDASTFPQLDIRQAVTTFDTVFLVPPLARKSGGSLPNFWDLQNIGPTDLLRLLETDRVRLVIRQPEERCDVGFLREAHEVNPRGVSGRRTAAAFLAADIVETADEYTLAKTDLNDVGGVTRRLAEEFNLPVDVVARSLLYPLHARRNCLAGLHVMGLLSLNEFGVGPVFNDLVRGFTEKDLLLEADAFGSNVQIAHALNATYIPPVSDNSSFIDSWMAPMHLMGDRLNFYRSCNTRLGAAWIGNERIKQTRKHILPPLPMLDFHDVDIDEIIAATAWSSTRRKGRALISRLAEIPVEERLAVLEELTAELKVLQKRNQAKEQVLTWGERGLDVGLFALGAGLPPIFSAGGMLRSAIRAARRSPSLDGIEHDFNREGSNEDLHFLSKVSRVATLQP